MLRPIKHDKASKHKKSKGLRSNIAVHPFVLVAIMAALAVAVFLISVFFLWFIK